MTVCSPSWADCKIRLKSMAAVRLAKRLRIQWGMQGEPQNLHLGSKLGPNPPAPLPQSNDGSCVAEA
jgi:hypothetical protein